MNKTKKICLKIDLLLIKDEVSSYQLYSLWERVYYKSCTSG